MKKIIYLMIVLLAFAGGAKAQCAPPTFALGEHGAGMCWGASPSPGITAYNVYRANGACSVLTPAWNKIATTPPTQMSYKDLTAAPGVTYCYTFTAVNANGQSGQELGERLELTPPKIIAPAPAPPLPPGAPSGAGN